MHATAQFELGLWLRKFNKISRVKNQVEELNATYPYSTILIIR